MKTAQYIKKYHLQDINMSEKFDFNGLVNDLGNEFKQRIENSVECNQRMGSEFTYSKFLHIVQETKGKFHSISNRKIGQALPDSVFNKVYAVHIIPLRSLMFPLEHEKATQKRNEFLATESL